jgi:hypothetical protein
VARRILDNLRYANAVLELGGEPPKLLRLRECSRQLPGIYERQRVK